MKAGASTDWSTISKQTTKWTDTTFDTNDMIYWADYTQSQLTKFYGSGFKRAYSDLPNTSIWGTGALTDDVDQGELGDCYYLAGCASIGEWTSRLTNSVLTQTTNTAGIFAAKVYIKGIPTTVVVDDRVPYNMTYGWLQFTQ